ncbi:hypothetical protein GOP47_0004581 [Adiantum capillus-veneris]|uniref:C2H2-type domain-containing protein n=1 Tax=Adiantum capillus-veneris TaxID=13818 RepID=A0A9D4ZMR5_ADICA|nr:hypothetical protein GOP47_0004581 [Adiantum capillus-veneris]
MMVGKVVNGRGISGCCKFLSFPLEVYHLSLSLSLSLPPMSSSPPRNAAATMADDGVEDPKAAVKRKRNLPGTPDPEAEVIALSPKTLMATNRFLCEVCGKGFQRDQNLQLHRRGHNLPWKLKQRDGQEVKRRVYVCPEASCIHHDPSRALGDLTGIKKHFSRKHGEKKWKCEKCSKQYAVQSDWKAHQKVCGTREYRCDCGTLFSRRDSFITHRAFCDALAQENAKVSAHRPVKAQQSSDTGGNAIRSPARELSSAMEASPSSFRQQATSERPSSEILEPLGSRDSLEVNSEVSECRGLKGLQGGLALMPSNPMIGPGLALSLGTGLGPGPPRPSELIGSLSSRTVVAPLSDQMNKLVDVHPGREDKIRWPPPLASAGIFTSMLAAANGDSDLQECGKEVHSRIGDAQLFLGISPVTETSGISQFANSTYSSNGLFMPKHQRQHTGSAQLPATTLLQKAAIMGVTKSNSFLFRNLGHTGSASPGESRQHDSWTGVTSSPSSSWHSLSMQPATEGLESHFGSGFGAMKAGCFSSTSYGGQERAQEFRDPSGASLAPSSSSSCMTGVFLLDGNKHCETVGHSDRIHEGSRRKSQNNITCAELEGSQRVEMNRMTLDFLGVGDHGSFQKDECNNDMLGAGVKPERLYGGRDS